MLFRSAAYCAGNATPTVLSIAVTGAGPWSGTLSNGQSFSGASSPISVTVPVPSSTTVYTIASLSDANCTSLAGDRTGSATVSINARPTAALSGSAAICSGETTNLTIAFTGTAPFTGTYSNGSATLSYTSATTSLSIPVAPTASTTYTLLSVADANACGALSGDVSGIVVVTVNPSTLDSVLGIKNVCPYVGRDTILS